MKYGLALLLTCCALFAQGTLPASPTGLQQIVNPNDERLKVFKELEAKAEVGETESMRALGEYYYEGRFPVVKDRDKSKEIWIKGASLGSAGCAASVHSSFYGRTSTDSEEVIERTKWYIIHSVLAGMDHFNGGVKYPTSAIGVSESSFEEAKARAAAFLAGVKVSAPAPKTSVRKGTGMGAVSDATVGVGKSRVSGLKFESLSSSAGVLPVDERVELDISTPKNWGMLSEIRQRLYDAEKISVFKEIYLEFLRTHSISEEGEFVSGGNTADTRAAIVYFQDYVNRNGILVVRQLSRKCTVCKGAGVKLVPYNPEDPLDLKTVRVDCPNCPSDGRIATQVTFAVTCRPVPAEVLPEKPRITKQKALVARANSGDAPSLVEYATQLEKGVLGVDQDIPKAKEMFAKAAVLGNGFGIDGLIRILDQAKETDANARHLRYVLRLSQAALDKRPPYYIVTDELGVLPPAEMPYIEAKVAEVEARLLYFGFKERKLNPTDLSDAGLTRLLETLKKSLEKNPIATAIQKVEYVLVGMALSKGSEGFGSDKLKLAKEAAESDNPVAFGILGDVSERGLQSGKKNRQAAAILYGISKRNRPDKALEGRLQALESRHDRKVTSEMIGEYDKTKVGGRVNINFIEAVLKIEQTSEIK